MLRGIICAVLLTSALGKYKSVVQVTCPKSCTSCQCKGCKNITLPLGKCVGAGQGAGVIGSCSGDGSKFTEDIYFNAKCQGQAATKSVINTDACIEGSETHEEIAFFCSNDMPIEEKDKSFAEIATHVNAQATTWTAEVPSRFESMDDVRMLCGTVLKSHKGYKEFLEEKTDQEIPNENIAAEFDVRTGFPKCASVSGHIRDQSACGSCWAFGSTEAFNDRRCIATGDTTLMSAEDTTANCGLLQCMSMGCGGGQPGAAWNWFKSSGVVTGGDYEDIGKGDTCGPYTLKACAHHVPATSKYPACPSAEYSTPSLKACDKSYSKKSYSADKKKASASYSLSGISKIQSDIQQYGSVTAAFTVYGDFPTYKSGVYKHVTGSQLGGHAVKILGWGTESGQDYWLVANSWNEQWGDHGLFKIARGHNECGIESQISAGTVSADAVVV
jgi:cathepsin B